jgi:hypothetical protein
MLGKGINGARNNLRSIPQSCTLYQQLMWYNSKLTELDDVMKINMQNSLSCQSCRLFFASIDSFPLTMNCLQLLDNLTYRSSFAVTSSENTDSIAVIAWDAVFSVSSKAPAIIVVSSCVNSPPFPAWKLPHQVIQQTNSKLLCIPNAASTMAATLSNIVKHWVMHSNNTRPNIMFRNFVVSLCTGI